MHCLSALRPTKASFHNPNAQGGLLSLDIRATHGCRVVYTFRSVLVHSEEERENKWVIEGVDNSSLYLTELRPKYSSALLVVARADSSGVLLPLASLSQLQRYTLALWSMDVVADAGLGEGRCMGHPKSENELKKTCRSNTAKRNYIDGGLLGSGRQGGRSCGRPRA